MPGDRVRRSQIIARGPVARPLPEVREADEGFEAEHVALLRSRLRLLLALLGAAAGALYALHVVTWVMLHGWSFGFAFEELPLLSGLVLAVVLSAVMNRVVLGRRAAELLDTGILLIVFGLAAADANHNYASGENPVFVHVILWTIMRAVVVPSRATRTVLVSLPGPIAILLVQILHGWAGDPVPGTEPNWAQVAPFSVRWWYTVLWYQIYLVLGVVTAAFASRVIFSLHWRAYEARRVDRYIVERLIGQGAMGEVYRARHGLMRRPVALKFVRPEIVGAQVLERFEREVHLLGRLTHPNTVTVYDYGVTADGVFYYAMELLEGANLERIVEATGPMPPARVLHVLVQACGSLAEAHAKGLVHRDVKPSNLILAERGLNPDVLKVTDFGLAKDGRGVELTHAGEILGTPITIAPECVRGEEVGPAADIYSLAAVGCYLLTGQPLFRARNAAELLWAHVHHEPLHPSALVPGTPEDLEAILLQALAKDPAARPASAKALRGTLLACADAGRWSEADAERWWTTHGSRFTEPS